MRFTGPEGTDRDQFAQTTHSLNTQCANIPVSSRNGTEVITSVLVKNTHWYMPASDSVKLEMLMLLLVCDVEELEALVSVKKELVFTVVIFLMSLSVSCLPSLNQVTFR